MLYKSFVKPSSLGQFTFSFYEQCNVLVIEIHLQKPLIYIVKSFLCKLIKMALQIIYAEICLTCVS